MSDPLAEHFRYRVNFYCIFVEEKFYTLLFMGLCILEIGVLISMLRKTIAKKNEIVDPDVQLGEYQTYSFYSWC